ncbi:MAG: ribonuclease D [Gammaproteobacteria bacterium]|nr:MAG: ribonuclease D [Gammaproteobacteria bacterium]
MNIAHEYIDTDAALANFCESLAGAAWLVIDTEFMRERTYRPELCLIQVKYKDRLALIDTIAIDSLAPLQALLRDTRTEKVFHAASQDLEIFHLLLGELPTPLFDTQIAAPLLGYNEQIGYANLVREHLGIELDKHHTRTDWSQRPLSSGQARYALDDVIHLEALYLDMRAKLAAAGRLAWLDAEFAALEDPSRYEQPASERWKRIRQIDRYKGDTLTIIQKLATWREIKAREFNKPRNWIMKDDAIVNIARQAPGNEAALGKVRGLDKSLVRRHGREIVELIAAAEGVAPESLPKRERRQKLTPARQARAQLMKAWVYQRAAELDIAPTLLVPDRLLEDLARGAERNKLAGWREALVADDLMAIRDGKKGVMGGAKGLRLVPET